MTATPAALMAERAMLAMNPTSLPDWAQPVFPQGLEQQSPGVWAPHGLSWSLAEQAQTTLAAARRGGGGPAVSHHFEHLLQSAIAGLSIPREPLVLDLCSGDGAKSAGPWLNVAPEARIVASDPASILLATLVGAAAKAGAADRVIGVIAEPESTPVAAGSVDLVSGVACLHERADPDRVLAAAAAALRLGGHAIFMAPFDGHGVLRLAYERIRAEAPLWPDDPLTPDVAAGLDSAIFDISARTLPDTSHPSFAELEQKWLFSREALAVAGRNVGFSDVRFLTHNDHETLYRDMALVQVRMMSGSATATLPGWALEVLDSFDRALRPPVKRLLMLEGTVVLTK
jgi:SAM-dependent methyltransferase